MTLPIQVPSSSHIHFGLRERVCIVTGGAQGIGEACIRRFAAEGAKPVIVDVDDARGQALAQELPTGLAAVAMNPVVINTAMLQTCYGEHADNYSDANTWSKTAAPFLLGLDTSNNGEAITAP